MSILVSVSIQVFLKLGINRIPPRARSFQPTLSRAGASGNVAGVVRKGCVQRGTKRSINHATIG